MIILILSMVFDNQNRIGPQRVILSGLLSAKEIKIGIITAI